MKILNYSLVLVFCFFSTISVAKPHIYVEHGHTLNGFAKVRVSSEEAEMLACYVAIDGYKIKFKLMARQSSQWYQATDKRFNHTNISTWCDYLSKHPEYNNY